VRLPGSRVAGLLITAVFLILALSRVDLTEFVAELRRVNYVWLLPSAVCTLLGYMLRTVRWRVILSGEARAPFTTLFSVLMMGFATNNLLPGRLGELWRAYLLGRKRNVRKTHALASVVVERVFDGLTLIALLVLLSTMIELPGWGRQVEFFAALIFVGATATLAVLLWQPGLVRTLLEVVMRPLPTRLGVWAAGAFDAFVDGLGPLRLPPVLISAALLSIGVWFLEGSSYLLLSRGINLGLPAGTEAPAIGLTLVTINLGIMVPSAPGYLGTQEFFGTSALGVFGVSPQSALALVLVSHAVQYVLVTTLGLLFFAREHLSPGQLRRGLAVSSAEPTA
jgi:glycosyltransferase 2 family protein